MTYSCSDFTDDVVSDCIRYGFVKPKDIKDDDPESQAAAVRAALASIAASRACVLISVNGGVADFAATGRVEVEVVDIDSIKAGDPKAEIPRTTQWRSLVRYLGVTKFVKYLKEPSCPS